MHDILSTKKFTSLISFKHSSPPWCMVIIIFMDGQQRFKQYTSYVRSHNNSGLLPPDSILTTPNTHYYVCICMHEAKEKRNNPSFYNQAILSVCGLECVTLRATISTSWLAKAYKWEIRLDPILLKSKYDPQPLYNSSSLTLLL